MGVFKGLDEIVKANAPNILNFFFIIVGIQLFYTAYKAFTDKTNEARIGTGIFWGILGVLFIGGDFIPSVVSGALVCVLALITLLKKVKIGTLHQVSDEVQSERADKIGSWIFFPVIMIGVSAIVFAKILPSLSGAVVGVGAFIATIFIFIVTKAKPKELVEESDRMVQQVSSTGILPQLLAAIGAVFTAAGVGDVIASLIAGVIPADSQLFGVIAYVLGMVLFTMIMGNAFAAFAVITVGIGIPFVFNAGADPAIASALAMTAGFCGTLMTPMAGNFNALPAALLEMKSPYSVIKQQVGFALVMIVVHIALMYFWAF